MKVLVTGAAGRMGSATCKVLLGAGHDVIATDRRGRDDLGVEVHVLDLLDRAAVDKLASRGVDAVVHAGNHIDFEVPDPQKIFGENMLMNVNVLQAAMDNGARKMIFASSVQTMYSVPRLPKYAPEEAPVMLPMSERTPIAPTNPYALSKACGELLLQYYVRVFGVQAVALRCPWMLYMSEMPARLARWQAESPWVKQLLFAYLSFEDMGRLVAAILATDLPGYRVYAPASKHNMLGRAAQELAQEFFAGVPLSKTIEGASLVDISTIERETGWAPKD